MSYDGASSAGTPGGTRFCIYCGFQLADNANFCRICGSQVVAPEDIPAGFVVADPVFAPVEEPVYAPPPPPPPPPPMWEPQQGYAQDLPTQMQPPPVFDPPPPPPPPPP
ncbi:MAG: zinc-ribbon domain-containing protein, partial [Oscillospiraceae bacterium]|nr:zinc-ribbon domain-containing protein [Oscillospiraceae bacterium]